MSKHGKKKSRKPRKHGTGLVLMCSSCLATEELSPQKLMGRLADALNSLEAAGIRPRNLDFILAEGERGGGFILPPFGSDPWTVHMATYHPSVPHLSRREDDLDS
jgi:hypothetical protein